MRILSWLIIISHYVNKYIYIKVCEYYIDSGQNWQLFCCNKYHFRKIVDVKATWIKLTEHNKCSITLDMLTYIFGYVLVINITKNSFRAVILNAIIFLELFCPFSYRSKSFIYFSISYPLLFEIFITEHQLYLLVSWNWITIFVSQNIKVT